MQLHQLEYFVALADVRHFGRAAQRCHIAQPSLSKQIRLLEKELGTSLVQRTRGNVQLTSAGASLYPHARRVLADVAAARDAVCEENELVRGRVRLGATPSTSSAVLPRSLARFHSRYPGIQVELVESGSRDLLELLRSGGLDLAIVVLPLDRPDAILAATPLLAEDLVLAVRHTHPLVAKNKVTVRDLHDLPMVMFRVGYDIRSVVLAACRDKAVEPRIVVDGGEMDAVLRLASAGIGAAVVPEMVLEREPDLVGVPFTRPQLSRTIAVAYRSDTRLSPAAAQLRATIESDVAHDNHQRPLHK
ncbi:MAG: LysR family transcriptional regulator [Acidimicrobiia bacterium]